MSLKKDKPMNTKGHKDQSNDKFEFHNAVEKASKADEIKLLTRDERKEYEKLREILGTLTSFQIRFVEQYIRTASAGKAARLAGSNSVTPEIVGYKMLQNPNIQMAIAISMKKRIEAVGLDTVEVIQKIREVYDAAMSNGKFAEANKACELLQKEIERASKYQPINEKLTKVGARALKTEEKAIYEEDGVDAKNSLTNIINLVKAAESRSNPSNDEPSN